MYVYIDREFISFVCFFPLNIFINTFLFDDDDLHIAFRQQTKLHNLLKISRRFSCPLTVSVAL